MRNALQNNNLKTARPPARAGFARRHEQSTSKLHNLIHVQEATPIPASFQSIDSQEIHRTRTELTTAPSH
ncbi:hypothetical protein RISK_002014 [Rhodopirellula islandica]|uniref:Uncharacterized protein n=1 Tax=Rhodopirellula islandica TaxID=595434 RepID=A0A0J1BI80_RHOIS|nr:hypothetical protein RISK_002014 [Rhodopirellula islandica]